MIQQTWQISVIFLHSHDRYSQARSHIAIMLIWYKFSYEHNIEYNRSKLRALHPIGKINLEPNYASLVTNNKIIYTL